jgi:hypothetical protein
MIELNPNDTNLARRPFFFGAGFRKLLRVAFFADGGLGNRGPVLRGLKFWFRIAEMSKKRLAKYPAMLAMKYGAL